MTVAITPAQAASPPRPRYRTKTPPPAPEVFMKPVLCATQRAVGGETSPTGEDFTEPQN